MFVHEKRGELSVMLTAGISRDNNIIIYRFNHVPLLPRHYGTGTGTVFLLVPYRYIRTYDFVVTVCRYTYTIDILLYRYGTVTPAKKGTEDSCFKIKFVFQVYHSKSEALLSDSKAALRMVAFIENDVTECKNGFSNEDIDDWVKKTDVLELMIWGIADGTIDVSEVSLKQFGILNEEE